MTVANQGFFACICWTFFFGILCPFAPTYPILCFLRMFVGFGAAGGHVAITIFSEFLPSNKRALFIMLFATFWVREYVHCVSERIRLNCFTDYHLCIALTVVGIVIINVCWSQTYTAHRPANPTSRSSPLAVFLRRYLPGS